jgi:hypothetical protein
VVGLLYLVVEMMQLNRRETVLNEVQTDMRQALDYINRDAREAVFVYSTPTAVTGELDDLPTVGTPPVPATPILAFWRPDPVDVTNIGNGNGDCEDDGFTAAQVNECEILQIRQSAYTLVVYLQTPNNDDSSIWQGQSRIIRYELPKYRNLGNLTQTPGYQDPVAKGVDFETWTPTATNTDGNAAVLTDYIDAPDTDISGFTLPGCPSTTGYVRTPGTEAAGNSFFVCARDTGPDPSDEDYEGRQNQDLLVFLRGDALDGSRGLGRSILSDRSSLPTLKSEILVRGVLDER